MSTTSHVFAITLLSLLGVPLLAPLGAWLLHRQPANVKRLTVMLLALVIVPIALALVAGISTSIFEFNAWALGIGFLSTGVLGISAFGLKRRAWGILVGVLASLGLGFSLLLGTVGALAVAFIVGDKVPIHEETMPDHHRCYVTTFGNATTAVNGYEVAIRYPLPFAPFLEIAAAHQRFESPTFGPGEACKKSASSGR